MATGIGEMRLQDRQASGWQSKPANLFAFDRKRYCDNWASARTRSND